MVGKMKNKEEVAEGTLAVTFQLTEPVSFKSGQYIFVTLTTLNYPDERGPKRQFSINNDPSINDQITITTRLSDSGFKKTLHELPIGTEVELGPIAGVFTLPEDPTKPLVLIAGGIGITPFMSMLNYVKEQNLPYKITLIYSNRSQASTAYLSEIQQLSKEIADFKLILTMTDDPGWIGEKRMVGSQFIKDYFPSVNAQNYMVVGPPGMVDAVRQSLTEAGVNQANIKFENFTGY